MTGGGRLPPLAAEDYACGSCGIAFPALDVAGAIATARTVPGLVGAAVAGVPQGSQRTRPAPDRWSVAEYACHVRDVYATYTIRLHRTRTEDDPALEPMFNDLRAVRFRYNAADLGAVLSELEAYVEGFVDEALGYAGPQWDRTATRRPGERRTARWLVRQAAHEGVHHARDIAGVGAAVSHPT